MIRWVRSANRRAARLVVGRVSVSYRGWRVRPFVRRRIAIGRSSLYCWGPLAIIVDPKEPR